MNILKKWQNGHKSQGGILRLLLYQHKGELRLLDPKADCFRKFEVIYFIPTATLRKNVLGEVNCVLIPNGQIRRKTVFSENGARTLQKITRNKVIEVIHKQSGIGKTKEWIISGGSVLVSTEND